MGRALLAESLGTFALVFFGAGATVVDAQTEVLGHLGVAVVFGLVVAAIVSTFGPISGAHINPAATLALVLSKRFKPALALPYIAAQLVGASLGAFLLLALFGNKSNLGVTIPAESLAQSFVLEVVMTFFLLLVALRTNLAWAIGAVVGLEAAMGGPISGASMNPARSFGPALASGIWTAHWIYWLAPLLGAALAAGLYLFLADTTTTNTPTANTPTTNTPTKENP